MSALRHRIGRTAHQFLSLVGQRNYKPFFVLSRSRSGSNLLVDFLNSHHGIYCESERFAKLGDTPAQARLDEVYGREPFYIRAKGFKIFYYHPLDRKDTSLWQLLINNHAIAVIHLKRRNLLRSLVSRQIAERQQIWATSTGGEPILAVDKRVTLDVRKTIQDLSRTRHWEKLAERQFRQHEILTLYYEDLVKHTDNSWRQVTRFLGVPYKHPQTTLRKQNPESLRELIRNYDEIQLAFRGTEWEAMLEE
ncbi:hypothetical protein Q4485_01175 [Granulosicoccaceae sp. 1_MG-2023]|nr:hypothetical protein [Granulosicoccaceae sp. 1_MG-2023]